MNLKEIGLLLKDRRKELALDQRNLARLSGISVHSLSDIEAGKGNPTLESLSKITDVMGLEICVRIKP
jgi:transcriptional regulator with XRE-family HTH domain